MDLFLWLCRSGERGPLPHPGGCYRDPGSNPGGWRQTGVRPVLFKLVLPIMHLRRDGSVWVELVSCRGRLVSTLQHTVTVSDRSCLLSCSWLITEFVHVFTEDD